MVFNYTLFTHDYLNQLLIGYVTKRLESGLIASTFTHSLANRFCLRKNYDYLHKIYNCNIVGGASYIFLQVLWFGCLCICWRNKQSGRSRLLKFQLEQTKQFVVFFLLIACKGYIYVVGRCFLAERGIKHPICMYCKTHQEWYLCECCSLVSCVFGGETSS